MEKESKRESSRQNKKKDERRYVGENKRSYNAELLMGKKTIHQKVWQYNHKRCHKNQITHMENEKK